MKINYPIVKLENIFEIERGGSPRPIQDFITEDEDGVNWISISDASSSSKFIKTIKKKIKKTGVSKSRMVFPGDLLLTNSMSFGHPYIMQTTGCIHDGWLVLRKKMENIYPDFFYYLLGSGFLYSSFSNLAAGAVVKNLNIALVKKVGIPLPPLDDQIRIAAVLTRAENLIAKCKERIKALDELLKSTFLEMFGDPVKNEKGWEKTTLNQFGTLDRGVSKHRPRNAPELLGGKYPLIQTGEVSNAGIYLSKYSQTYSELGFKQSKLWKAGTLCITIAANIAKTSILTFDACFPDSVVGLITNEDEAHVLYVHHLFGFFQKILEKNAPQAAQKNINLEILRNLQVPKPPLPLQKRFAIIADKVESLKSKYTQSLAELENLYGSLSQRAFKGELDLSKVPIEVVVTPEPVTGKANITASSAKVIR